MPSGITVLFVCGWLRGSWSADPAGTDSYVCSWGAESTELTSLMSRYELQSRTAISTVCRPVGTFEDAEAVIETSSLGLAPGACLTLQSACYCCCILLHTTVYRCCIYSILLYNAACPLLLPVARRLQLFEISLPLANIWNQPAAFRGHTVRLQSAWPTSHRMGRME